MKMQKGFTLIELMIVVVIIGILSAIAIPNYKDYVTRGRLIEGTSTIATARSRMEQYFTDSLPHTYVGGPCPAATTYFNYACGGLSTTAYTITATGKGTVAGYIYTIDQNNTKTSTTTWGNSAACWVVKKGGGC